MKSQFKSYFAACDEVLYRLCDYLRPHSFENAVLAGGGYGYESQKYSADYKPGSGDLDLFCVVDRIKSALGILGDPSFCERVGYEGNLHLEDFIIDASFFEQRLVSVIRASGSVDGLKVGINFTTFERLKEIFSTSDTAPIYKIAHTPTYSIIVGAGTDGSSVLVSMIPPEISSLFSGRKHWLIPDHNWYLFEGVYYCGLFTDFIATGKIIKDTSDSHLQEIQTSILRFLSQHSTPLVRMEGTWERMFANHEFFSDQVKQLLRQSLSNLSSPQASQIDLDHNTKYKDWSDIICVFPNSSRARNLFQLSHLSESTVSFKGTVSPNTQSTLLRNFETLSNTKNSTLELINAETIRLSTLVSMGATDTYGVVPESMTLADLSFDGRNLTYLQEPKRREISRLILENAAADLDQLRSFRPPARKVLRLLTRMRIDTVRLISMLTEQNADQFIESCAVGREFKDLFHARSSRKIDEFNTS